MSRIGRVKMNDQEVCLLMGQELKQQQHWVPLRSAAIAHSQDGKRTRLRFRPKQGLTKSQRIPKRDEIAKHKEASR